MTAKVAAGGADKDGGNSGKTAFALDRVKNLRDPHGIRFPERAWAVAAGS